MRDFYEVLGVSSSASQEEIKAAFRKKASEIHPDKHIGASEQERAKKEAEFKELNAAHAVLSDSTKRAAYDMTRAGVRTSDPFGFGVPDFGINPDIFRTTFRRGGFRTPNEAFSTNGTDIERVIELTLEEINSGSMKELSVPSELEVTCRKCQGTRSDSGSRNMVCVACGGSGRAFATGTSKCKACGGHGDIPIRKCQACAGKGRTREEKTVKMRIPFGISDGQRLRLAGQGTPGIGGPPGDLYVTVKVAPHPRFERKEDDLWTTATISLGNAMKPGSVSVRKIDGTTMVLSVPPGFVAGQTTLRIRDSGLRRSDGTSGDMMVTLHVEIPIVKTARGARLLEELMDELK